MSRDKRKLICYDWMLEFLCHDVWRTYSTGGDIDQGLEDLATGIMLSQKDRSGENIKAKEVAFLNLLVYLCSLKKNRDPSDEADSEHFELQHVHRVLDDLSFYCDVENINAELAREVRQKTLLQLLLTLCRQNQFEKAQELFATNDCLGRDAQRKIQAILHSKNTTHRLLKEDTLTDYIATMTQYLEAVYHTFPSQPIMMKLVKHITKKQSPFKRARYSHHDLLLQGSQDETVAEEDHDDSEGDLNDRLQDVRSKLLREAVKSVVNANDGSDTGTDKDDAEADGDVHTSQERRSARCSEFSQDRLKKKRLDDHQNTGVSSTHSDPESIECCVSEDEQSTSLQNRVKPKILEFKKRDSLAPPKKKATGPQMRLKWTQREEEDFYKAVQKHGVGQWLPIRRALKSSRSNVQLKDKWRTILKTSYDELCRKFGPVEGVDN